MSDYYSLLGVPASATESEIRTAYRKKAKIMHPDVNKAADAHSKFVQLTTAYETLIHPNKREKYNLKHRYGASANSSYNTYQEWVEMQKQKAEHEVRLRYYEFLKNREKFRKSRFYFLAVWLTHLARFVSIGFGAAVIIICLLLIYHLHFMMFFFLLPFICAGVYLIKWTGDWYQSTRKYF